MNKIDYTDTNSLRVLAEKDSKVAISKVEKKKLERDGSYAKRLKDKDFVEINPDKPDMIGQGIR